MKQATVVLLIKGSEVLLGMKKTGFGDKKWNGPGGKVKEGESIEAAAIREVKEEFEITIDNSRLESAGEITFFFSNEPKWSVYIFRARDWQGEPAETQEMRPQWFDIDYVPYKEMWVSDQYWMPKVLDGKSVHGNIYYDSSGNKLEREPKIKFK